MTEDFHKNEEYLVQVPAQVMTRDDSSGGWVPMGGGGLSRVALLRKCRTIGADSRRNEYVIYGQRIADDSEVLKCNVKKDIRYTRPNPKFHHWHIDDKRYGLTFERSDDAREFDKGVRSAVADLIDGCDSCNEAEVEEEIFGELDLPISHTGSSSQSTTSTTTSSPQSPGSLVSGVPDPFCTNSQNPTQHLHRVIYFSPHKTPHKKTSPHGSSDNKSSTSKSESLESSSFGREDQVWVKNEELSGKSDQGLLDTDQVELKEYSYVIFQKKQPHEYSYPNLESMQKPPSKRESTSNVKDKLSHITQQPRPPLPVKKKKDRHKMKPQTGRLLTKARCKHCHEMFSRDQNPRGSCYEAPDGVEKCIEIVTCVWCTKGLIYHCMSDADGEYVHPCTCDTSDDANCKKWTALSILSFLVPCLWCYWPLKACHMCGVACGCCGSRHKAM